jgi:CysZ protein
MFRAIALGFADLADRRVLGILLQALAVTVLIFAALTALAMGLLSGADPCSSVGAGSCPLDTGTSGIGAILLVLLAVWFLFPAVAIAVITTFTDRIARAIEERHYPVAARQARPIGVVRGVTMGLRSAGRLILFNLLALPFYLLLLVTGLGPFILFVIVNGFAFGRDLGEIAAARHGDHACRRTWLKATRGEQHFIGTLVGVLFLVPVANLLAPVLGTAAVIHLFNRSFWRKERTPEVPAAPTATSAVSAHSRH